MYGGREIRANVGALKVYCGLKRGGERSWQVGPTVDICHVVDNPQLAATAAALRECLEKFTV